MKFATFFLLLALAPLAQTQDDNLNFAIRESFIKCYANHWKGTQVVTVRESDDKVRLVCGDFWKKAKKAYEHPDSTELSSPFVLITPGNFEADIPYSTWATALNKLLDESEDHKMENPK